MSDRKDDDSKLDKNKIADQNEASEEDSLKDQASNSDDKPQDENETSDIKAGDEEATEDKTTSSSDVDKAISEIEASLANTKKQPEPTSAVDSDSMEVKTASDKTATSNTTTSYQSPEHTTAPTAKAPKTTALWFLTVLNLLLLIGVGGAGFWFWQQTQIDESNQSNAITSLESKMSGNDQATRDLTNQTNELKDNQAALTNSIDNLLAEILSGNETDEALQKRLSELSGRRPSDWLLAEADYLVNMAGRKLYLENDVKTATTLLREADSRLEDLNDPALFPVRTLIAADIAALNQVNNVSETSVALAIGGLIPQASTLPLRTLKLPEPPVAPETMPSSDIREWKENLARVWNDLTDDLVNKTPIDGPIAPYLSESQQWLIEQQLKYALSRAQTAALAQQTKVFEQNLLEAVALIDEHYELEEASVRQFLGVLENLLNTDFSKDYPARLQTQQALKDILEQRVDALFNNGSNTL